MEKQKSSGQADGIIAGRYEIERLLGEGGMGQVYLVRDTMLGDELVALKLLRADLCSDERHAKRFLREVQLTRKVTHPNIVRTFDAGSSRGTFFFTMEYAQGVTLREKLKAGRIAPYEVAEILAGICDGLSAIHTAEIIHRDLKPGNIIITPEQLVKITDFGVARPGISDLTSHNEVVGSIAYMAPEIWLNKNVTNLADIYSLGILAFEMLVGEVPFGGDSPAEVMCKHLEQRAAPPIDLIADVPLWLSGLVVQMLHKDSSARPVSASEIASKIREKLQRRRQPSEAAIVDSSLFDALKNAQGEKRCKQDTTQNDAELSRIIRGHERQTTPNTSFKVSQAQTSNNRGSTSYEANLGVIRQRSRLKQTDSLKVSDRYSINSVANKQYGKSLVKGFAARLVNAILLTTLAFAGLRWLAQYLEHANVGVMNSIYSLVFFMASAATLATIVALPAFAVGTIAKSTFSGLEAWLRLSALSAALVAATILIQVFSNQVSNGTTSVAVVGERIAKSWKPAARQILATTLLLPSVPAPERSSISKSLTELEALPIGRVWYLCLIGAWVGTLCRSIMQTVGRRNSPPFGTWLSATLTASIAPIALSLNYDLLLAKFPGLAKIFSMDFGVGSVNLLGLDILSAAFSWGCLLATSFFAIRSLQKSK